MSHPRAKHRSLPAPKTTPVPRSARVRLILAGLLAILSLGFLGYRAYRTLAPRPPALLRLGEDIPLTPPPPLPTDDDRLAMRKRLLRLEPLRAAARARPNDPTTWLDLAREAARQGDLLSARDALHKALRLDPQAGPVVEDALGRCQIRLGLYTQALRTYQNLLPRAPQDAPLYIGLSHAQSFLEQTAAALETLERGARAVPERDIPGRLALVAEFERQGVLPRALAEAQAIHADAPDQPDAALAVARLLFKLGRLVEARPLLEQLVAAHPDHLAARRYLALVLDSPLLPERDRALAEHILLETVQRDRLNTSAYQHLGEIFQEQKRYRQAAVVYTRLLEVTPDSALGRLQLSRAYTRLGDRRTGEEQRRIAARLLARDQAESRLIIRRDRRPTDPQARLALARHYVNAGQLAKAFVELQAAYCLAPESSTPRRELLALYAQIGVPPPSLLQGGTQ